MASVQKDIAAVLLKRVFERNLISESVYRAAGESINDGPDLPDFLGGPEPRQMESPADKKHRA